MVADRDNKENEDGHVRLAAKIFGVSIDSATSDMRYLAKTVGFGVTYGLSQEFGEEEVMVRIINESIDWTYEEMNYINAGLTPEDRKRRRRQVEKERIGILPYAPKGDILTDKKDGYERSD